MFGYSSFDNYFGTSQTSPYTVYNGNFGMNYNGIPNRPPMRTDLASANYHRNEDKYTALKVIGGIAAATGAIALILKGKGKGSLISNVKKLFTKTDAAETVVKEGKNTFVAKFKKLFEKTDTVKTAAKEGKNSLITKFKNLFGSKVKSEIQETVTNIDGDTLNISESAKKLHKKYTIVPKDQVPKVKSDIAKNAQERNISKFTPQGIEELKELPKNANSNKRLSVEDFLSQEEVEKLIQENTKQ